MARRVMPRVRGAGSGRAPGADAPSVSLKPWCMHGWLPCGSLCRYGTTDASAAYEPEPLQDKDVAHVGSARNVPRLAMRQQTAHAADTASTIYQVCVPATAWRQPSAGGCVCLTRVPRVAVGGVADEPSE